MALSSQQQFVAEVEAFLREKGVDPTVFGRDAMRDPTFVFRLRRGRESKTGTIDKVRAYMAEQRAQAAA
jgi:2,4-dienoyl-CoA reductase-like NADH-dependent reductase (Old Yellow Enzyme family)